MELPWSSVEHAVAEIRAGRMVVVVDDADRENEGDLVMAADLVTADDVNFMATHARGLICVALSEERLTELALPPMIDDNTALHGTAFTVSVDLRGVEGSGISAADRAATIVALTDPETRPEHLARPGHIFPLAARRGGVLRRKGHTEAACDLAALAGCTPAGVLVEVMAADGTMARGPQLERFAVEHRFPLISVAELTRYRREHTPQIIRTAGALLPTAAGDGSVVVYESLVDGRQVVAVIHGDLGAGDDVLVRLHSECLTGDVLGSTRCECGEQLRLAKERIAEAGRGVLLYVRGDEGRGIGLTEKVKAYFLQDQGHDTVDANLLLGHPADRRDHRLAAEVLLDLGVRSVSLLTNNPRKCAQLEEHGVAVTERVPLLAAVTPHNVRYLVSKRERLGHLLDPAPGACTARSSAAHSGRGVER